MAAGQHTARSVRSHSAIAHGFQTTSSSRWGEFSSLRSTQNTLTSIGIAPSITNDAQIYTEQYYRAFSPWTVRKLML
jgi:hypothetical protein